MPQHEIRGDREGEMAYNAFHREASAARFIDRESAHNLPMINIDHVFWIEYNEQTKAPVALVESARDVGQKEKAVTILKALAVRANLPCYTVLYQIADDTDIDELTELPRITGFRVRREWPDQQSRDFITATPEQYFAGLWQLRKRSP